jgi:hypothetical protein
MHRAWMLGFTQPISIKQSWLETLCGCRRTGMVLKMAVDTGPEIAHGGHMGHRFRCPALTDAH